MKSCLWLMLGLALLSGCTALATVEQRTQRLILTPEQVASIRESIGAHPCASGQRATVVGAEARDEALHLLIACVGR